MKMLKPWFSKMLKEAEVPWDENPVSHSIKRAPVLIDY